MIVVDLSPEDSFLVVTTASPTKEPEEHKEEELPSQDLDLQIVPVEFTPHRT